jgi:hypothetical protein
LYYAPKKASFSPQMVCFFGCFFGGAIASNLVDPEKDAIGGHPIRPKTRQGGQHFHDVPEVSLKPSFFMQGLQTKNMYGIETQ